jgi:O-antigen/teichoic acid export membrane protein
VPPLARYVLPPSGPTAVAPVITMTETDDPPHDSATLDLLSRGTARMASATGLRQVLSMGMLAVTAAIVARALGPTDYGFFAGGTAAYTLAVAMTDFGFSLLVAREMSRRPAEEGALLSAAMASQLVWSAILTGALFFGGLSASGPRGTVMLVMCPALAANALGVTRAIFTVRFRASPLLILDVSTTLAQCAVMVCLALLRAPVYALAINISVFSCVVGLVSAWLARGLVRIVRPPMKSVIKFFRTAFPYGVASVMASLYFTIDLTLLGWLVSARSVGHYAVAVRFLTIIVLVPGFIMGAGFPGLSRTSHDESEFSGFSAMLAHWIFSSALPLGVGVAVFAEPAIRLVFGSGYVDAVPIVRILMLAALLSFVSNITGLIMMTLGIIRPQIYFNSLSLIVNVAGNLLLVPHFGIEASAWLTVVSEAIVVSYGLVALRKRIAYGLILQQVWRPVLATTVAGVVGMALGATSATAVVASALVFVGLMTVIGGWPEVFLSWVRARRPTPGHNQG